MSETPSSPSPVRPSTPSPKRLGSGLGSCAAINDAQFGCGKVDWSGEIHPAEEDEAIDAEDVQPVKGLYTPEMPSRAVIEQHRVDHWPYRSWCDECNEGFGREASHGH